MSNGRFRSFLTGTLVGAGLGILLAPKEGSETRNDLKKSFSLLVDTIKNVDVEETKANLLNKVKEIREELSSIDENTVKKEATEKLSIIEEKCDDLIQVAKENTAPVVERAALEVKENAKNLVSEFLEEIEEKKEEVPAKEKKTRSPKKDTKKKTQNNKKQTTTKKKTTSNTKKASK